MQYYNSFLAEKLRKEAKRSAFSAAQYFTFIDRIPPGKGVKRAIDSYLNGQKSEFEKVLELLKWRQQEMHFKPPPPLWMDEQCLLIRFRKPQQESFRLGLL